MKVNNKTWFIWGFAKHQYTLPHTSNGIWTYNPSMKKLLLLNCD